MAEPLSKHAGEHRKTRLFLSYSRKDLAFAETVNTSLEREGYDVLLDRTDIAAGEDWQARLGRLITEADTVVFCLSPESAASRICGWEVAEAERQAKRILPVVARQVPDADLPPSLAKLNFIFMDGMAWDTGFAQLKRAIETNLPWLREHTRLLELAQKWSEARSNLGRVLRGKDLEDAERWIASQPLNAAVATDLHRDFVAASRRAATLRQRYWIGGAAAVVALSLGLAGWSEINRREAVRQQTKAEKLALAATNASSALVFDVVSKFEDVAGMPVEVSHNILIQALKLQVDMTQADGATPELRNLTANTMRETAATFLRQGDSTAALLPAEGAVTLLTALTREFPDKPLWRSDLGDAHVQHGDVLMARDEVNKAEGAYFASLTIFKDLLALEPENQTWQANLARSLDRMGDVERQKGNADAARANYLQSLAMSEKIAAAHPNDGAKLREVSVGHFKIGELAVDASDLPQALDRYQRGLSIDKQIVAIDPKNTNWLHDLSVSHSRVGEVLMKMDKPRHAEEQFRAGLAIDEKLVSLDPNRVEWQRDYSVSHSRIGEALEAQKNYAEALRFFTQGLVLDEKLVARDPTNSEWQRDLSVSHMTMARMYTALQRPEEARASLRACLAIRQELVKRHPEQPDAQRDLAQAHLHLALAGENSHANLTEAARIYTMLQEKGSANQNDLSILADVEKLLAASNP